MASKSNANIIFSSYYNLTGACPIYQQFSALHHGDYDVLWGAELWFVVCGCVLVFVRQKYSENCFDVGIIAVEYHAPAPQLQ
jgi:hypothetical protein